MEPKIIFEDEHLLVLDKPAGMIVNRSDTTREVRTLQEWVEDYLKIRSMKHEIRNKSEASNDQNGFGFRLPVSAMRWQAGNSDFDFRARAGIVHRLDKETSGIILVAKTLEAFINLQSQFKERKVQKTYLALAHGKIEPETGEINVTVGRLPWNRKRFGVIAEGRESVTRYRVTTNYKLPTTNESLTLVELSPKTGRTHQIRVHLQYIKHPIFADPLYAGRKTSRDDRKLLPRVFLHASKISFFHPKTNELLNFESPLSEDLNKFLRTLKS